jgi:hypothetical protein
MRRTVYYRENMQCTARLHKDGDGFRRRMGKHKQFHYVATVERQERGAFHIPVAVHARRNGTQIAQAAQCCEQDVVR